MNYWDEDPEHPLADWQHLVRDGDTRQGYWQWVGESRRAEGDEGNRCDTCGAPALDDGCSVDTTHEVAIG